MKITESQLRRIIREQLLINDPDFSTGATPVQAWSSVSGSTGLELLSLLKDIVIGMTPAGLVLDIKFLIDALKSKQSDQIAIAGIAFLPGLGDAIAAPFKKLFRHFDEPGYIAKNKGVDDIGPVSATEAAQARREADEIIDSWESSGMSASSLDEILEETGEAMVRGTRQRLSIPRWGQPTTIGYHGTDQGVLRSIKERGLDNFAGTPGDGLTMMRVTSNWTYTPDPAIGFSKGHSNPVLLRFETRGVTSNVGTKSVKKYNTFKIEMQDGSTVYARPKNPNIEEFHRSPIGDYRRDPGNQGWFVHGSPAKRRDLLNDMEFSNDPDFLSVRKPSQDEINNIALDSDAWITGHTEAGLDWFDSIGTSNKPIPPGVIEYSLDDGRTWSHILDYES